MRRNGEFLLYRIFLLLEGCVMRTHVSASRALLLALCVLGGAAVSRASIVGPYAVDKWALHIWHLDEPAGSKTVADEAAPLPWC